MPLSSVIQGGKTLIQVLVKAINTYGKESQLNMVIEEMSELTKEICKHKRGNQNRESILEELADVYITLEQLCYIFEIKDNEIREVLNKKLERLKAKLEEGDARE